MGKKGLYLYIILWVVYSFNGVLYEPSGILARGSILLILFMSIIDTYYVIKRKIANPYIKGLNLLLLMFTIYGVLFILNREPLYNGRLEVVPHYLYIKTILMAFLPFYTFYRYAKNGVITKKVITKILPLLILIALVNFVYKMLSRQEMMGVEGVTNNIGYFFVALMPFAYILDGKRSLQYFFLFFNFIFTLISVKRGAILIATILLLFFLFNSMKIKKNKGRIIIISIVALAGMALAFNYMVGHNDYFASRLEGTINGTSGNEREDMYTTMFEWYIENNSMQGLLLGNGPYTSIKLIGQPAHNDWLEIALAQGFLGIIIYMVYWFFLAKTAWQQKHSNNMLSFCITSSFFIIFFLKTFFSMSYASIPFYAMLVLSFAIAQQEKAIGRMSLEKKSVKPKFSCK